MKEYSLQEKVEWAIAPASGSPSVVVTLPFDPKMTPKSPIEAAIKDALAGATRQLMARYPRSAALPVIDRLQRLTGGLNFSTHKKSIALFVSPGAEKVLYMDEPMEAKVLVDSDFRMRDLTLSGETNVEYLLLLLSGQHSKMYRGEGGDLQLIKSNSRKEMLLDKFLHHMDEGLTAIHHAYPLPVFVIATDKVAGHFARITRNDLHIAGYLHKNCMKDREEDLVVLLQPFLRDWRIVRQQMALKQLDTALEAGKLAIGIEEVSKAVRSRNNRMLIVERGFSELSGHPSHQDASRDSFVRDRVDAIIGQVLQYGGRVEWVDQGRLDNFGHIALVRYF